MSEVTFEDMQRFLSKYTVLKITPESHLVKDLYFKWKDGLAFLRDYSMHFRVDILACQPQKHFRSNFIFLPALIVLPIMTLSLVNSSRNEKIFKIMIAIEIAMFLVIACYAYTVWKQYKTLRLPAIDLTVADLVRIANVKDWPREMYEKKHV